MDYYFSNVMIFLEFDADIIYPSFKPRPSICTTHFSWSSQSLVYKGLYFVIYHWASCFPQKCIRSLKENTGFLSFERPKPFLWEWIQRMCRSDLLQTNKTQKKRCYNKIMFSIKRNTSSWTALLWHYSVTKWIGFQKHSLVCHWSDK